MLLICWPVSLIHFTVNKHRRDGSRVMSTASFQAAICHFHSSRPRPLGAGGTKTRGWLRRSCRLCVSTLTNLGDMCDKQTVAHGPSWIEGLHQLSGKARRHGRVRYPVTAYLTTHVSGLPQSSGHISSHRSISTLRVVFPLFHVPATGR